MVFNTAGNRTIDKLWEWLNNTPGLVRSLLIVLVYIVVGVALEELADLFRSYWTVQPWDPGTGWYIFLLFTFGLRYAPAIILVSLIENLVFVAPYDGFTQGIVSAVLATTFYAITCGLGLYKLNIEPRLLQLKDIIKFAAIFFIATLIYAVVKMSTLLILGNIGSNEFLTKVMHEWAGEATGIVMLTPPLLIICRVLRWSDKHLILEESPPEIEFKLPRLKNVRDWIGIFAITIIFTWAAHGGVRSQDLNYTYFVFIPLTLISAWKGFEAATVITLSINVLSVFLVGKQAQSSDSLALQFGLMTVTYIGFLLSAYISELVKETNKRRGLEKQLRYDATHDSLTGLYNRAWFIDRLEQTNSQINKSNSRLSALLFLDLDRFKVVNDTFGHTIGDKLLGKITQQLQQCLPESASVARLGGDEFTIILEQVTNIDRVSQIAETICQSLGKIYTVDGYEVFTTVSVGVALNTEDCYGSALDWLRDADIALYEAKIRGNQYTIFDARMYQRVYDRTQLEQDLRKALDELK